MNPNNRRGPPPNRRVSFDGDRGYNVQPAPPIPGLRRANTISELPEQAPAPRFGPPQRVGSWPTQRRNSKLSNAVACDVVDQSYAAGSSGSQSPSTGFRTGAWSPVGFASPTGRAVDFYDHEHQVRVSSKLWLFAVTYATAQMDIQRCGLYFDAQCQCRRVTHDQALYFHKFRRNTSGRSSNSLFSNWTVSYDTSAMHRVQRLTSLHSDSAQLSTCSSGTAGKRRPYNLATGQQLPYVRSYK